MSLSSDLSLIDFFLDSKNESILNSNDKDTIKNEEKAFIVPEWDGTQEEMFGNFKFDFDDPALLPLFEGLTNENYSVPESNCSDSGMSSDLQMSPMEQDEDEETTNAITTQQFQDDMQVIYTDQDIESHEEIELDSSDVSFIETNNCINVETLEENTVIETQLEEPKEKRGNLKIYNQTQVLKVTPLLGNSRPVLLPISLKDLREMQTIKIIKQPSTSYSSSDKISSTNSSPRMKSSPNSTESHTSSDEGELHYPRLELTHEEKKLLQKEGVRLPEYYPLTKQEERELKRIRRKIRNKISAQDSRKRKKEYIDGLEDRVKKCTEENLNLVKRIKQLENQKDILQNQKETLVAQIRKLQAAVSKTGGKSVQPATCLMVLMLSMALVMMPSLRGNGNTNSEMSSEKEQLALASEKPMPLAGRSRSLLFKSSLDENEQLLDGEKLPTTEKLIADLEQLLQFRPRMCEENNMIDEDELFGPSSAKRRFIIPPLDDVWPPPPDENKNITLQNSFSFGNETKKMNISDIGETRSIVLPKDII